MNAMSQPAGFGTVEMKMHLEALPEDAFGKIHLSYPNFL